MLRVLGHIWAAPVTLAGLLFVCLGRARRLTGTVYVATPGTVLAAFFTRYGVAAFTWGAVICFGAERYVTPTRLTHERRHTTQAMCFGPLLPLAYGLCSLWALLHGRDAYRDNALEVDARGAER